MIFKKIKNKISRTVKKINFLFFKLNMKDFNIKRKMIYELNEKAFLRLFVEEKNSMNWNHRKNHLDIVTRNRKNKRVGKIIKFFSNKSNYQSTLSEIVETDNSRIYNEPISHDKKFWNGGNNYFINCLIHEFKKNVVPYSEANKFISNDKNNLNLYSTKYYESLETMNEEELRTFLKGNPIEVTNNCVTSGKHRVYAMIGRIAKGKDYIPFYVEVG